MARHLQDVRIGVDIGGTFTDIIAFDPAADAVRVEKVSSTPANPALGVIDGLERLFDRTGIDPADVTMLSHGSTVTINALIEHDGANTGLLVTEGFSAIPLARKGEKPVVDVKNPRYKQPETFVPQEHVLDVPERVDADGEVVQELDEAAAREAVRELRDEGVESIAVCLLFAFLNPTHEQRLGEIIAEEHPDCAVSLASDVAPRIREYPRLSTTTVNAYVDPILGGYLTDLEGRLADLGVEPESLSMMLSHGGLTSFDAATQAPVNTVLSGPAAGVQGALFTAAQTGDQDLVTMDMGGTSCDIAVAPGREAVTTTDKEIEQNPVSVPLIDIQAIGAGGGTIVRVEGGRLRVGPDSAGADPGPVCYGRGGERPTITDADLVLGRLSPDTRLAGDLELDADAAREALREQVGDPLELSVAEAAAGVVRVVDDKMKKELALALTRQGYDPREFALVVYGGAGPMHAPAIARELSLRRVVVPPRPGINSAVGLLTTDRRRLYERSRVDRLDDAPIGEVFAALEAEAREDLAADTGTDLAGGDGPGDDGPGGDDRVTFSRELELRYAGQSYEVSVDVPEAFAVDGLRESFDESHREAYGHVSDQPLETMTYRLAATTETPKLTADSFVASAGDDAPTDSATDAPDGDGGQVDPPADPRTREVYFDGAYTETPVYHRDDLGVGTAFAGPAIVEQTDTTVVVEPGMDARVDHFGNIVITIDPAGSEGVGA